MSKKHFLRGIVCKCNNGHVWKSEAATIWTQMPRCPKCGVSAVSWKGEWLSIDELFARAMTKAKS